MNYAYCTGVMTAKINFLANMLCAEGLVDYADYEKVKGMCEKIVEESKQAGEDYDAALKRQGRQVRTIMQVS